MLTAADTSGLLVEITAVRGHTVLLDNTSALIADLAIDTANDRLFLSNITQNLVELLQLDADPDAMGFTDPVQVGSRPWGIFMGERVVSAVEPADILSLVSPGDTVQTLIVGNSGGTNVSLVHIDADAANVQEVDVVRLRTPNTMLFEIDATALYLDMDNGYDAWSIFNGFDVQSDRPGRDAQRSRAASVRVNAELS